MEDILQKLLNVVPPPAPASESQMVPHAGQQLVAVPSVHGQPSQGLVVHTDRGALMLVPQPAQQQIIVPSQEELGPETLASTAMMAVIMLCVVMMMQTLSHSMMMRRLL